MEDKEINKEILEKILEILKENKPGMTLQEIADKLKTSRITARKYLAFLEGAEKVKMKKIGKAKFYYL